MATTLYKVRLKKGDSVMVRAGKFKGQSGKIIAVLPATNEVLIEGINVVKRHRKPSTRHPQGTISEITKPLPVGKVGLLDISVKKPSKIGIKQNPNGSKVRYLKTSGKEIK